MELIYLTVWIQQKKIDFKTYEDLHQRKLESPISKTSGFSLKKIGQKDLEIGYRFYDIK